MRYNKNYEGLTTYCGFHNNYIIYVFGRGVANN